VQLHGVTTGRTHACALDPFGAAWCWGNGDAGQAGNGSYGIYRGAVPVSGGKVFRALAAGLDHTCGLATDSRIYCWGDNYYGQLGAPNPSQTLTVPTPTLTPM
jgi:alpha-tubulin suppressor-like RCC1 family protein